MPTRAVVLRAAIAVIIFAVWIFILNQDEDLSALPFENPNQAIGPRAGTDIYSEIAGTVFFKHRTGVSERVFDWIYERIGLALYESRNVRFKFVDLPMTPEFI